MIGELIRVDVKIPNAVKEIESLIQLMIMKERHLMSTSKMNLPIEEIMESMEANSALLSNDGHYLGVEKKFDVSRGVFEDYVVGGGFPCDLYREQKCGQKLTSKSFKDCDFFVEEWYMNIDFLNEILPDGVVAENVRFRDTKYAAMMDTISVTTFTYKGIDFEIISVVSMDRVETFDFRFRNFFYKQNQTYASKGALNDIEKRELIVSSPHTPVSSLVRGIYLEKKYGFTLTDFSKEWLLWELKNCEVDLAAFDDSIRKRAIDEVEVGWYKEKIREIIGVERVKKTTYYSGEEYYTLPPNDKPFPFGEEMESLLNKSEFRYTGEETLNRMLEYKPSDFIGQEFVYEVEENDLLNMLVKNDKEISEELTKSLFLSMVQDKEPPYDSKFLSKFSERSAEEKFEVLKEGLSEESQHVYLWFSEMNRLSFGKDVDYKKMIREINRVVNTVRITLNTPQLNSALEGDVVTVDLRSPYDKNVVSYLFRKTLRGVYVLAHTFSDHDEDFHGTRILNLISFLKEKFPDVFDFGISGEEANPPKHRVFEYFFTSTPEGYFLRNIEQVKKVTYQNAFGEEETTYLVDEDLPF